MQKHLPGPSCHFNASIRLWMKPVWQYSRVCDVLKVMFRRPQTIYCHAKAFMHASHTTRYTPSSLLVFVKRTEYKNLGGLVVPPQMPGQRVVIYTWHFSKS